MTLSTLSPASQTAVSTISDKLNNRNVWVLSEIVAIYKSDATITPEHIMVRVKGIINTGAVYGAWFNHKTGIDLGLLNLAWIGKNYHLLTADETLASQMNDIKHAQKSAVEVQRDADIVNGIATVKAFTGVVNAFKVASESPVSGAVAIGSLIAEMELSLNSLKAKYATAVAVGA